MKEKREEILKAHEWRQAIKEFIEDKKIPEEEFEFILETGRLSPSSFGWEPWKFLVVQNKELRSKLAEVSWGAKTQLPTASHFVVLLARKGAEVTAGSDYFNYKSFDVDKLPEEVAQGREDAFANFQKNEFDLTDDRKKFDWAAKQVYLPFANMMTAAAQIGIDSCPIEGFDMAKVDEILSSKKIVDTDKLGVAAMIAFGYRKADSPWQKNRQSTEQVVEWIK